MYVRERERELVEFEIKVFLNKRRHFQLRKGRVSEQQRLKVVP